MKVYHKGENSFIELADAMYSFGVQGGSYGETDLIITTASTIEQPEAYDINGGYQIIPEGTDNRYPYQLRQLLDDNYLMEGVLQRMGGLQYGQGLAEYETIFEEGKRRVIWDMDPATEAALNEWDYEDYLFGIIADNITKRESATKFLNNKGLRIGKQAKLVGLKHVPIADYRREWPDANGVSKRGFVADWRDDDPVISVYPTFNPLLPDLNRTTIYWDRFYQFGRSNIDYTLPKFHGSRKWIQRSNVAPDILKAQTDNGLHIKWHIISPKKYWDNKAEALENQCRAQGKKYTPTMLEDLKDSILASLAKVLSGLENVGKFFHSESVVEVLGVSQTEVQEWKIIPIDMKVKDFTEAQILISKHANSAITSSGGLAPSLANIIVDGNLPSGSEKLYDYKLFIATETPMFMTKNLKALNMWYKIRFPNSTRKLGYYHDIVKREEDLTASERTTNNEN